MPTEVIEAVNALSNSEDEVPRDLTFHYGDLNIADDSDDNNAIDPESDGKDDQGTDTIVPRTSEEAAGPVASLQGMTARCQRSCIPNTSPSITTKMAML